MLSALYYPNTRITNADFLKNCLLLWDQVEYIIPHPKFQLTPQTRDIDEALELIATPHLPSEEEKLEAHKAIVEIAEKEERPKWLFFSVADRVDEFSMFSGKLLSEAWRALERSKLARPTISEGFNAFATQKSLGFNGHPCRLLRRHAEGPHHGSSRVALRAHEMDHADQGRGVQSRRV